MNIPADRYYTKDHEWAMVNQDQATIGITTYAARELGEVVFVELPNIGKTFAQNEEYGSIESVKAVAQIYAPVSGEVIEINETVKEDPEQVNEDPHGDGWLVRMRLSNTSELKNLMDASQYEEYVKQDRD